MKIGEAARRVGVAPHVLRHWDEVGVVVPARSPTGHRTYTDDHVHRLRVLMACQSVGLSLDEIRSVLHRDAAGRNDVIARRLAAIREQRRLLEASEAFLTHVIDCRHDLLVRCPTCSEYARPGMPGPVTAAGPSSSPPRSRGSR